MNKLIEDPKQRKRDITKAWKDNLTPEQKEDYNKKKSAREREKRKDPEYRAKANKYHREYYARNILFRELILERRKDKYNQNQDLRDRVKKTEQYNRLKRLYGIELDELLEMIAKQDNQCAICGTSNWGNTQSYQMMPNIDHDHLTGKVRGLLCKKCNSGLSYFYDNPQLLLNAVQYLQGSTIRLATESV